MKTQAMRKRIIIALYLFSAFVLISLIVLFPIGYTGYISFTNMSLYHWNDYSLIGFSNYRRVFSSANSEFLTSLWLTILWTVVNMILQIILSFIIAVLLNTKKFKGARVYKTILMIPWALPGYVSVLLWRIGVFNSEFGLLSKLSVMMGLGKVNMLGSYWGAFFASLILNLWMSLPFMITMIDGAIQSVDKSLYESAEIDGAGFFKTHAFVTWPEVWPIIMPSVVMTTFVQFKQFDIVYLLTLQNGGDTGAGLQTIMTYAYTTAFMSSNYGLSSAVSVVIFVLITVLFTIAIKKSMKESV